MIFITLAPLLWILTNLPSGQASVIVISPEAREDTAKLEESLDSSITLFRLPPLRGVPLSGVPIK